MPSKWTSSSPQRLERQEIPTDIVVIDDDIIALELIRRFLKRTDYSAVFFDDSREAIEFLESYAVRILLVDNRMPGLSGIEVLENISVNERVNVQSIYLCSAAALPRNIKEQAQALGATALMKDLLSTKQQFIDFVAEQLA